MTVSPEAIERKALEVRHRLGLTSVCAPDMTYVLDQLSKIARLKFKPALAAEMGRDEAWMDNESQTLTVRESVFEDAKAGRGRARFTLAHELGHFFLGHEGRRRRNPDKDVYAGSEERLQEQEADIFASFFLVPTELASTATSSEDVANRFQVSAQVAEIAFERIQAVLRRAEGTKRPLPESVVDFLLEAKRRGHEIRTDLSKVDE